MILIVPWGYQELSIEVSPTNWSKIKAGEKVTLSSSDSYDGENFSINWEFNSDPTYPLVVTYGEGFDMGTAFNGKIEDAEVQD